MRNFIVMTPYKTRLRKSDIKSYGPYSSGPGDCPDDVSYVIVADGTQYCTDIPVEKLDALLNSD